MSRFRQRYRMPLGLAAVVLIATACTDQIEQRPAGLRTAGRRANEFAPGECVATYRMITSEDDELAAVYDWPLQVDTIDLCETWSGSDYRWKFMTIGTSERASGVYDMARDASYDGGWMHVMDQGNVIQSEPTTGPTLFDSFNTDQDLRAAAYDDPYYAIRSLGGSVNDGGGGGGECCLTAKGEPAPTTTQRAGHAPSNPVIMARLFAPVRDGKYSRHSIVRRGVRALVDRAEEGSRSVEGHRQFRLTDAHGEHVFLIAPRSQLLVGEKLIDGETETVTRHHWRPTATGYERERTVIETRPLRGERPLGRATIYFSNVRILEP